MLYSWCMINTRYEVRGSLGREDLPELGPEVARIRCVVAGRWIEVKNDRMPLF